jgi:RNA polymerase sigma-70 factor (ECF subfamily)
MDCQMAGERREELGLLRAVLEGDGEASRRFFNRYNRIVEVCVRAVLRRTGRPASEEDIQDMVSEIWLSLMEADMRSLRRFDPARQIRVSTWIGLLARNKTIDRLRTARDPVAVVDPADTDEAGLVAAVLPGDEMEKRECCDLARAALQGLEERDQRFLEAWYVEDCDPAALACQLGVSVGTVYSRRCRIERKLARAVRRIRAARRPPASAPN